MLSRILLWNLIEMITRIPKGMLNGALNGMLNRTINRTINETLIGMLIGMLINIHNRDNFETGMQIIPLK